MSMESNGVTSIRLVRATSDHPDFATLYGELDRLLTGINGEKDAFYSQFNRPDGLNAVIAYIDARPAACGAYKPFDAVTVEIKRMYSRPEFRKNGLGSRVLAELEAWARETGATRAVLESASALAHAHRLYESKGYVRVPNFGPYVGLEESYCFEKFLV
jgi:GNAT superfamily N-acetyltransferase